MKTTKNTYNSTYPDEITIKIICDVNTRLPKGDGWTRMVYKVDISENGDIEVYGSSHYRTVNYTFRYQNNNFEMISAFEMNTFSGGGGGTRKTIDFLLKKKLYLEGAFYCQKTGDDLPEKETAIEFDKPILLFDIKDFGKFNIDEFYTQK